MGRLLKESVRRRGAIFLTILLLAGKSVFPAKGCTIFVLTDGERTLFFNNEDWSNPVSRVWFVPAPEGFHSCVYVGFENNGAEGGMNSAGLAFDWVAGFTETWTPDESMQPVGGRTSERMLETCATVEEAISFYQKYREPQFNRAKILVADKSGASVIIGARDGKLQVDRAKHSRGFGYGRETLATMLQPETDPAMETGLKIIRACEQKGQFATKYSSVFDLNNGDISLFTPGGEEELKLNLAAELKRGAHYYDIPKLKEQLAAPVQVPLSNMRSFLREFIAAAGGDANVSARVLGIVQRSAAGAMRKEDFAQEFWKQIEPFQKDIQADLEGFGDLRSAIHISGTEAAAGRGYLYKLEFKNAWVLQEFIFDSDNKMSSLRTLGVEWKHPPPR
jgi:hypothetical protein